MIPCQNCGEAIIFDGQRSYWPEGFPYVHTCEVVIRIPNEGDFCVACGTLTWGGVCDECKTKPVAKVIREAVKRSRHVSEGLDL